MLPLSLSVEDSATESFIDQLSFCLWHLLWQTTFCETAGFLKRKLYLASVSHFLDSSTQFYLKYILLAQNTKLRSVIENKFDSRFLNNPHISWKTKMYFQNFPYCHLSRMHINTCHNRTIVWSYRHPTEISENWN